MIGYSEENGEICQGKYLRAKEKELKGLKFNPRLMPIGNCKPGPRNISRMLSCC